MTEFVSDSALDFRRQATTFTEGDGMALDIPYRRAHLPLVAPDHPDVIAEAAEHGYVNGRHEITWSLVVPVAWPWLAASTAFQAMDAQLRAGPLAGKISWAAFEARKPVLHATICGSLAMGEGLAVPAAWREALAGIAPFAISWRGLFSGSLNLGRLYMKAYPEQRDGENCLQQVQRALHRKTSALYVAGLYNLVDHLDAREAAWLAALLDEHRDTEIGIHEVDTLWIQGVRDDLALDSEVAEIIRLG